VIGQLFGPITGFQKPTMDVDALLEKTMNCSTISELDILRICTKAKEYFIKEENIVQLSTPISLVGDIHGQFWDFKELLKVGKNVGESRYLFLGDYVDRGKWYTFCIFNL
jgi:hypothetical protein